MAGVGAEIGATARAMSPEKRAKVLDVLTAALTAFFLLQAMKGTYKIPYGFWLSSSSSLNWNRLEQPIDPSIIGTIGHPIRVEAVGEVDSSIQG